jgi:hypothetical protein
MQDPITVAVRNTSKLLEGRLREKMIRAGKVLSSPTNNSNLKLSQSIDSTPSSVIDALKEDLAQLLGKLCNYFIWRLLVALNDYFHI